MGLIAHMRNLPVRLAILGLSLALLTGCSGSNFKLNCFLLCGPSVDTLGGTLSGLVGSGLVLQNNSAVGNTFSGTTANGSNVVFALANVSASYDLTVATQPTAPSQTCTVANGTGTTNGDANVTNITVTCTTNATRFVYVTNAGSNNVTGFSVDATSGALTAMQSPFAVGGSPQAIAVDPTGAYAYVANHADGTISAFTIDSTSGALTPVSTSPYLTAAGPTALAIDASS